MRSAKITAVIATKNEEHRLPLVLTNLNDFAEKTIVFDGGSDDKTESICSSHGIPFIKRPPDLRATVNGDIRFILGHVKTPYVLVVNCSHYYPPQLLDLFKKAAEEEKYYAVYNDIVIYTYGQIVHRPFFRRRSGATYFYRIDSVNFANSKVHNEAPVEAPDSLILRAPACDDFAIHLFRDYNTKKAEFNHSFYGCLDAKQRYDSGCRTTLLLIIWRPLRLFLFQFIRCGSLRYGAAGFIYTLLYVQLELNIQLKIWELQNGYDMKMIIGKNITLRQEMLDLDTRKSTRYNGNGQHDN